MVYTWDQSSTQLISTASAMLSKHLYTHSLCGEALVLLLSSEGTQLLNQPHEKLWPLVTSDEQAPHTLCLFSLRTLCDLKIVLYQGCITKKKKSTHQNFLVKQSLYSQY